MRVLLVRHGEAVDPYDVDIDAERWLTRRGRGAVRRIATALVEAGVRLDLMLTSPLVRATQTAEILASGQEAFDGPLRVWSSLAGGSTAGALRALDDVDPGSTVALVGHEPLIRIMAAQLSGVDQFPGFRTGTVSCVDWDGSAGVLRWILDPSTLQFVESPELLLP